MAEAQDVRERRAKRNLVSALVVVGACTVTFAVLGCAFWSLLFVGFAGVVPHSAEDWRGFLQFVLLFTLAPAAVLSLPGWATVAVLIRRWRKLAPSAAQRNSA